MYTDGACRHDVIKPLDPAVAARRAGGAAAATASCCTLWLLLKWAGPFIPLSGYSVQCTVVLVAATANFSPTFACHKAAAAAAASCALFGSSPAARRSLPLAPSHPTTQGSLAHMY